MGERDIYSQPLSYDALGRTDAEAPDGELSKSIFCPENIAGFNHHPKDDEAVIALFGTPAITSEQSERRSEAKSKVEERPAKSSDKTTQDRIDSVKNLHGVEIMERNGKYEYRLRANGTETVLLTTDNTAKGLMAADAQLRQMEDAKTREIEKRFEVQIARETDPPYLHERHYRMNGVTHTKTVPFPIARPTLGQLVALDSALSKCDTGAVQHRGMTVRFLDGQTSPTVLAFYKDAGADQKPEIVINKSAAKGPPTEKDAANWTAPPQFGTWKHYSLEGTLIHEITHHRQGFAQDNHMPALPSPELPVALGGRPPRPGELVRFKDQNVRVDEYAEKVIYPQLGWKKVGDQWLMEGKDGNLYKFDHSDGSWTKHNSSGQPIDMNGNVTTEGKALKITNFGASQIAKVTPASSYFNYPWEVHSEAEEQFISSEGSRGDLLKHYPQLYAIIKELDQRDINLRHPHKGTEPMMIRMPDGVLARNTPENRKRVQDFETKK